MNPIIRDQNFFEKNNLNQIGSKLRSGEITCQSLVEYCIEQAERYHSSLNIFTYLNYTLVREQAKILDMELRNGVDRGILHGIPIAIKDNIFTKDMPTTMGSEHYDSYQPSDDAICVKLLKCNGAIILGKTTTHEFAYGPTGDCSYQGPTRNPFDNDRIAGGSSCGSAVAVKSGVVPIALGTDTGGSARIPASLTGVIGFKPTYGSINTSGVFPLSYSLDHIGIISLHAIDISAVHEVLDQTRKNLNEQSISLGSPGNVAWLSPEDFHVMDNKIVDSLKEVLIQKFNSTIEVVKWPTDSINNIKHDFKVIQSFEAYYTHKERIDKQPYLFKKATLDRLVNASNHSVNEYIKAKQNIQNHVNMMFYVFDNYQFLMMPTVPITAPKIHQKYVEISQKSIEVKDALLSLTSIWNLLGNPAISLPIGFIDGLPVGLQIISKPNQDKELLNFVKNIGF
ncbi:amidase [Vibrio alginolyticus]|uniref:amidase n=1 Tax=Vibrio alginolyticus TaxID=663 RepID=UPI002F42A256